MPDHIHAGVHDVQPPTPNPRVDRGAPETERLQLPPRDDPMLTARDRGHLACQQPSGRSKVTMTVKRPLDLHDPSVAQKSARGARRSLRKGARRGYESAKSSRATARAAGSEA